MMLALALVVLGQGLPAGAAKLGENAPAAPPPSESAKLYFLAGDLSRAVDFAARGQKTEPKKCKPLFQALVQYQFLARRSDAFTPAEAKEFIALDKQISQKTPGRITEPVLTQWVRGPLQVAAMRADAGDASGALELVTHVLSVDPGSAEALAMQKQLTPDAGSGAAKRSPKK